MLLKHTSIFVVPITPSHTKGFSFVNVICCTHSISSEQSKRNVKLRHKFQVKLAGHWTTTYQYVSSSSSSSHSSTHPLRPWSAPFQRHPFQAGIPSSGSSRSRTPLCHEFLQSIFCLSIFFFQPLIFVLIDSQLKVQLCLSPLCSFCSLQSSLARTLKGFSTTVIELRVLATFEFIQTDLTSLNAFRIFPLKCSTESVGFEAKS